jgi:PAS domain S-box-containing protein
MLRHKKNAQSTYIGGLRLWTVAHVNGPERNRIADALPLGRAYDLGGVMSEFASLLFSSDAFLPHGSCLRWTPALLSLWVVSDVLIALAYYSIPVALIYFVRKRQDLAFHWMFLMFGAFIFWCGTTHVLGVWTLWQPLYWLEGGIKAVTAGISITTAALLWSLIPRALALPSPAQLAKSNAELSREITRRQQVEAELRKIQEELEQRVQERTAALAQANMVLQQEIAAHQRTETELRDSEARLQAILDQTRAAVYLKDLTGRYLLDNHQHQTIAGLRAEQILGKTDYEVFPHELAEQFRRNDQAVIAHGRPLVFEETALLADGLHSYLSDKFLLHRTNGEPYAVCGISVDITERKHLEAALQRERDLWKVTLTSIGDGVIVTNPAAEVTFMNPVAEALTGWTAQEASGRHVGEVVSLVNEHSRQLMESPVEQVLRERTVVGLANHTLLLARDGREVPISDSGAPIRDESGQLYGAVMVFHDVTESRQAEAALRQAKEAAEAANRTKSDFLAAVSHELRTPLNIIIGYIDLLADEEHGPLTVVQNNFLRSIKRSALELHELIAGILNLNRLQKDGQLPVDIEEVHLPALLATIRAETQVLCERSGLQFVWNVGPGLESIFTDADKVKTVVKNLLGNAVKFTKKGQVTVDARPHRGGVEISISDTGIGIPQSALSAIFEPFRQVEHPNALQRFGGVGLGLYIVKSLLTLLDGRITVESELGRGSTFRIWLPSRKDRGSFRAESAAT